MSVEERLMKPGQWSLRLRQDANYKSWANIQHFDHVVITAARLAPPVGIYTDSNILAQSIYTGVIIDKPGKFELAGQGLAFWMGTDDGLGAILTAPVTQSAANLGTWLGVLKPSSIGNGSVTSPAGTWSYTYQWVTPREAIDHVCKMLGCEWQIGHNGVLNAAIPTTLFQSTPSVVITRRPKGGSGARSGIMAADLDQQSDVQGYTTTVLVVARNGDGAAVATASAAGANVYKDLRNNNVSMIRQVDAPDTPAASASAYATAILNLYSSVRKKITLDSRTFAVTKDAKVGDYVYVYDPETNITDSTNQFIWGGELITPALLRVRSITWPIQQGMGVYIRRSGATPTYTDITDSVEWERDDLTTWEVGSSAYDPDQDSEQLGPAYLGVNSDILNRVTLGSTISYIPTWSGTIGNGTLTGKVTRIGGAAIVEIDLVWGSTTTHAAGTQLFGLPTGMTALRSFGSVGEARLDDTGVARYNRAASLNSTIAVFLDSEAGVLVTNTVPFTPGNTDHVSITCALLFA